MFQHSWTFPQNVGNCKGGEPNHLQVGIILRVGVV
jgi:hypothetical protein